jgi:hypothetical protein
MDPNVAPFESNTSSIAVEVNIALLGIFEVDEKHKTMSGSYAIFVSWKDDRMTWNPSSYQNIGSVQVKAQKIWIPTSVCLFNEIGNENCIADDKGIVTVYSSGYVANRIFKENTIRCDIDVTKYPFDSQICSLQFININSGTEYITFDVGNSHLYRHYYNKNEVWGILSTTAYLHKIEGGPVDMGRLLIFKMVLQRKSFHAVTSTLLPVNILSVLNLFCFLLPIESGEKMGFCMSIFLSFAVFLTTMNESLPKSSDKVSYFTIYIIAQFIISGVTVVLEATVLLVHFHSKTSTESFQTDLKPPCKKKKFKVTSVFLDRTFFLVIVAIDVFSVVYYILNVC